MNTDQSDFFADEVIKKADEISALDLILRAQSDSATVGFDFANIDIVREKVEEELREMIEAFRDRDTDFEHFAEELGDCFFALVNLCRHAGIDPESLARQNAIKYLARCKYIEEKLRETEQCWRDLTPQQIYVLWKEAKQSGL